MLVTYCSIYFHVPPLVLDEKLGFYYFCHKENLQIFRVYKLPNIYIYIYIYKLNYDFWIIISLASELKT